MTFRVLLTEDAALDLAEIHDDIALRDSAEKAEYVLGQLRAVIESVAELPERGAYPKELLALGIRDYRETFFKPYRILYRVINDCVYVYLIVDGRRDLNWLLQRRLVRSS
ncbi:MAG: type II toxin-antitoxin system RelE/ParE family toxin [Candidatus Contendobacter sp.]|nr:type II toxin-antitoxin system RelE/ParE family toxin [Candidatus Contendobacter sp.]